MGPKTFREINVIGNSLIKIITIGNGFPLVNFCPRYEKGLELWKWIPTPLYHLRRILILPSSMEVGIIISDTDDVGCEIGVYGVSDYR